MENESLVWICPDIIESFPFPEEFKKTLSDISQKDYKGNKYFPEKIPALDLDGYEISLHKAEMEKTVDAVVGISDNKMGKAVNDRLLLMELKMDCETPYNLKIKELKKKKSHSEDILRQHSSRTKIDPSYCILFKETVRERGKSWLVNYQRSEREIISWKVFCPSSFCRFINEGKKIEYRPSPKAQELVYALKMQSNTWNLSRYDKTIDCAREYIHECINRYFNEESKFIAQNIVETLNNFPVDNLDEFQKEYFNILKEDTLEWVSRYLT